MKEFLFNVLFYKLGIKRVEGFIRGFGNRSLVFKC